MWKLSSLIIATIMFARSAVAAAPHDIGLAYSVKNSMTFSTPECDITISGVGSDATYASNTLTWTNLLYDNTLGENAPINGGGYGCFVFKLANCKPSGHDYSLELESYPTSNRAGNLKDSAIPASNGTDHYLGYYILYKGNGTTNPTNCISGESLTPSGWSTLNFRSGSTVTMNSLFTLSGSNTYYAMIAVLPIVNQTAGTSHSGNYKADITYQLMIR